MVVMSTVRSSEDYVESDIRRALGFVASPRRFNGMLLQLLYHIRAANLTTPFFSRPDSRSSFAHRCRQSTHSRNGPSLAFVPELCAYPGWMEGKENELES